MKTASISLSSLALCLLFMASQTPILGAGQGAPNPSLPQEQIDTALRLAKEILRHPVANPELLQASEEGNISPEEIEELCNGNLYAGIQSAQAVGAQAARDAAQFLATTAHENSKTVQDAVELKAEQLFAIADEYRKKMLVAAKNAIANIEQLIKTQPNAAAVAVPNPAGAVLPPALNTQAPLQGQDGASDLGKGDGQTPDSPFGKNMLSWISVSRLYQTALYVAAISATVATGALAAKQYKQFRARRIAARRNTENQQSL